MQELLIGLVLAAVTGLTFVAYRHPKEYSVLSTILLGVGFLVFIVMTVWNFSNMQASSIAYVTLESFDNKTFTSADSQEVCVKQVKAEIENHQIYSDALLPVSFGYMAFILILNGLPMLGIVEKKTEAGPKEPEKPKTKEIPPK